MLFFLLERVILFEIPFTQENLFFNVWGQKSDTASLKSSKIGVWCENFSVHKVLIYVCKLLMKKMKVIRASIGIWHYFFFQFKEKGTIPYKQDRGTHLPSLHALYSLVKGR